MSQAQSLALEAPDAAAVGVDERALMRKAAMRMLPLLFICYIANYLDRVNVSFAALTMNRDLGFSATVYGLGAGVFFIAYLLGEVPSNLIMQRVGARLWIARIMITWGIISGLMATVSGETSFYILRFLLGFAEAGFFPGILLYLTWWFPAAYRARIISMFMAAAPFAVVIGSPISGFVLRMDGIAGLHGWQWLFILEAVPSVVLGVFVLVYLIDRPDQARWLKPAERTWLAERLAFERQEREKVVKWSIWQAMSHPLMLALTLAYTGAAITNYGLSLWTPQIVNAFGSLSTVEVGFIAALPYLCATVGMILWNRHSDKTRERRWHVACAALLTAVGFAGCTVLAAPTLIVGSLCVAAIGSFSLVSSFWTLPAAFLSGTAAAVGFAMINAVGSGIGGFAGPYVIGLLRDRTGSFSMALLPIAIAPVITALIVLGVTRRPMTSQ
ncbi:MFS transporter [Chelatococcus sp. GCM10030263]|uniref:MFS transporter n=1 Tax=Chelatococcus sp. GCM10030263 TaxID=3273387 RepID=UPI00360CE61F